MGYSFDVDVGYIVYVDFMENVVNNNGVIYIGVVFLVIVKGVFV